jgi:Secretion system C-terminal sorting domain/FG-GAP-like repeat
MKGKIILLIAISVLPYLSNGQTPYMFRDTSVAVFHGSTRLVNPWASGMNTPVFAELDLNGDGKMDIIEFDAPSFRVNPFINLGIANKTSYVYAPEYRPKFPESLEGWVRTFDIDFDGDLDLFSYYGGGISFFRNDFSMGGGLLFTPITNSIQTHYGGFQTNIYASRVNAPALSDVDNDGDMDILAFSISGSWVEHHENFSMDSTGTPGQMKFHNIPVCWGYFVLANNSNVAILPPVLPTCPLMAANPFRQTFEEEKSAGNSVTQLYEVNKVMRHAGSSLVVYDQGGDGDKDVLNGDILGSNVLFLENCGTPDSAYICSQDTTFPSYNIPAVMLDVAGPHYFDGNNDGKKDFIASNFFPNGEDYNNVLFYENTTNNVTNVFSQQTNRWIVDGMIEVGTGAHPVFFDVDQDGKLDLLVGNDFYFTGPNSTAKVAYYRNTSSTTKAEYTLVTNDYTALSSYQLSAIYLTFGDIDGDNDQDMIVGHSDGSLIYFQNIAGAGNPCNFIFTQANYQSIDIGDNSVPQLIDVNKDGKLDLLVGERAGVLNYYQNTGSSSSPIFSFVSNNLGGVNVAKNGSFAGFSAPILFDNQGSYELLVGSLSGYIYHYGNIDGNLSGTFTLLDSMYQNIYEPQLSVPAMADVDGDTAFDLVVGSLSGGVVLYTQNQTLSINTPNDENVFFNVYPNPVQTNLTLNFVGENFARNLIEVVDVAGKLIYSQQNSKQQVILDVSKWNSGTYICRVSNSKRSFTQKIIKY